MKRLVIKDRESINEKIQAYFSGNEEARFIHRLHGVLLFSEKEDFRRRNEMLPADEKK